MKARSFYCVVIAISFLSVDGAFAVEKPVAQHLSLRNFFHSVRVGVGGHGPAQLFADLYLGNSKLETVYIDKANRVLVSSKYGKIRFKAKDNGTFIFYLTSAQRAKIGKLRRIIKSACSSPFVVGC